MRRGGYARNEYAYNDFMDNRYYAQYDYGYPDEYVPRRMERGG